MHSAFKFTLDALVTSIVHHRSL